MMAFAKVALVVVSVLLICVVLLQSGRSAGLSGAITGGSDQAANRRPKGTDSFLAKVTVVIAVLFFIVTLGIAYLNAHPGVHL
ncbi:preprotein translocase subunit SecG [Alicyclobacillus cycloheptanicus]|nr:preprotein translocase subunit SecG [Alicyclobacillus cycloheptanicus]WDL99974.1 preprotein translocase subunit SecG [Alicyclobacillus cycloheptanicus]